MFLDRCSHSQGSAMGRGETRDFYCSPPITGRYVYIVINGQGILTLCEVGVYSSSGEF